MAEVENMPDSPEQDEEERNAAPDAQDEDVPDDIGDPDRPSNSRVAENKGSFAENLDNGLEFTKKGEDWKGELYYFRQMLSRRKFFTNPDLGGKFWDEFVQKYLMKEREAQRNRKVHLRLERIIEGLILNGRDYYTTNTPTLDSPEKEKEFWHIRFMIKCYLHNRDAENSVFPDRNRGYGGRLIHRDDFAQLWDAFLRVRNKWFKDHPPPRSYAEQRRMKENKMQKKEPAAQKAKNPTTDSAPKVGLDQVVVTKVPDSPMDPVAKRFFDVSEKTWKRMVAEILDAFHLDGRDYWNGYRVILNESWKAIEFRAGKPLSQTRGTELKAKSPKMTSAHWKMIKRYARNANEPIMISLQRRPPGDEEESTVEEARAAYDEDDSEH